MPICATRLMDETARERRAMELLASARAGSVLPALAAAETALAVDPLARAGGALRARVFELAEALFQSVHMQLSVPRYAAIDAGRGANLDLIDRPITNADWLRQTLRRDPRAGERRGAPQRDRRDFELDQSRAGRVL